MELEKQERRRRAGIVQEVLRSRGLPLDPALRVLMEARFGRDFGRVRLHTDDLATASARAIDAQAYTAGSHIIFGKGRYDPRTREGLWLLAHELAHVVQQGGEVSMLPLRVGDADDLLERAADRAADLIAAGRSLPLGFAFSAAPAGVIQRHNDVPCPGTPIDPQDRGLGGNWAIELAYKEDRNNRSHEHAIFFGSQYENADVLLPKGAPNQRFGNMLLSRLRGLQNQRRPDIIDFYLRVFYEIKTPRFANDGMVQLESYYRIADTVRREYARFEEPEWHRSDATWYPPHVLTYPSNPQNIVCTQATDHTRYPGLILYDVRRLNRRERQDRTETHRATGYDVVNFDQGFAQLFPTIRSELPNKIHFYDPSHSNYVIIVPQEFYWAWYRQRNEKVWDHMRLKPSYDFPGGQAVKNLRRHLFFISTVVGGVAAVLIIVAAGAVAGAVAGGASVAVGSGAAAGGGGAAAGGGSVISLAAYKAMLAAPQVKSLAAAAGVLLVLGTVKDAQAAKPSIHQLSAIRAVSVAEFQPVNGIQSATSMLESPASNFIHTSETARGKFALETRVLFDGTPHVIIGQISVR